MGHRDLLATAFASALLAACASETVEHLNVREWIGHSEEHLLAAWGTPHHNYTMVAGGKMIGYLFTDEVVRWRPRGHIATNVRNCMINFETDRNGVILDAVTAGVNCRIGPHDQMHVPKTN